MSDANDKIRVCLINPAYKLDPSEDSNYSMSGYTVPHLGLGYISSFLQEKGFTVDLLECMGQGISNNDVIEYIGKYNYLIIGISVYDENRINAMRIINKIRRIKPNVFIFLGGYSPTLSYDLVLRNFEADCCIVGEGEVTTFELIEALKNGNDFRKVRGIAYLDENNIIVTEKRALIDNLDILPFPERAFYKNRTLTMITSRGCLCNCIYCSIISFYRRNSGSSYRMRSAENVIEELKVLLKKYADCQFIWYYDDNFLQATEENRIRLFKLCSLLKDNHITIPFNITACSKDIVESEELLKELKAVGLNQVFVGIESLCQRQLDFYNKNTTVEKNIKAIKVLTKLGIKMNMGFIPLDPFVTVGELRESFENLQHYNILNDAYNIYSIHMQLISVKGTVLRSILDRKGVTKNNDRGYDFINNNIKMLYNVLGRWHKIILPMVCKSDSIAAYEKKNIKKYRRLNELYANLIRLDIEYVISLCNCIENKDFDDETIEEHLRYWRKKYNRLYEVFNEALVVTESVEGDNDYL